MFIPEIDITAFFVEDAAPRDYSASAAELGQDAGAITWRHALEDSEEDGELFFLKDEESRAAFRDYVRGFGAWEDEEINAWDNRELNALFLQMVAGDIREADELFGNEAAPYGIDWPAYESADCTAGRLFLADVGEAAGRVFFYIGD